MNLDELKKLYSQVDSFISSQKSACKKGCSYCCHQQIEVLSVENDLIREYILDNFDEEKSAVVKNNLNTWLDYFDSNTPNGRVLTGRDAFIEFGRKAALKGLMCPFLINNECSIYEARPFTCRVHIVEANPYKCNEDKLRNSSAPSMEVRYKAYKYIVNHSPSLSVLPLPYVVNNIFNPLRELKRIEKMRP